LPCRHLAILIIHDLLGYRSTNTRLLADSYSALLSSSLPATQVSVYIPDLFDGETLDADAINEGRWGDLDMAGFMARNGRETREGKIFECAKALRKEVESMEAGGDRGKKVKGKGRVAAVGFCYGGWAALRLGASLALPSPIPPSSSSPPSSPALTKPLVDGVVIGHPSLVTSSDIHNVIVPTQILVVEHDPVFTVELKTLTVSSLMERGVPFDFQFFPGVEHGSLLRGDEEKKGEREAMLRARDAAVAWLGKLVN
jgi:dienelactone hydrolase